MRPGAGQIAGMVIDLADLAFEPGFQWAGTFVKRARYRGRMLAFRLSAQIVTNCLEPSPGAAGPIETVAAHEPAIETACRKAMHRLHHSRPTIDLERSDFMAA